MRHPLHFPRQHCLDVSRALHVLRHCNGVQRLQQCGRRKLAQFRLFVMHDSDKKNSPQPTRARGKACGLRQGGKHSFGPQVVAKHLGGFLLLFLLVNKLKNTLPSSRNTSGLPHADGALTNTQRPRKVGYPAFRLDSCFKYLHLHILSFL